MFLQIDNLQRELLGVENELVDVSQVRCRCRQCSRGDVTF
jgi:hypothetical protein